MNNLFLNLSLENTTNEAIQAKINPITRLENIFNNEQNTKNFSLSVNRFALPSGLIELLFIDDEYYIETKIPNLLYFNRNLIERETSIYELVQRTYLDKTQKIYSYEQFVEIINRTLFENYFKLSKELLRSKYDNDLEFENKTKIIYQYTSLNNPVPSDNLLGSNDSSFYQVDEKIHTFPENDVSNLIGIQFKMKNILLPINVENKLKCILISPKGKQFCIFNNELTDFLTNSNITFNECSLNNIIGQELSSFSSLSFETRFRESSLDILNDNPSGDWTIRFESLRAPIENFSFRTFDYEIEFIYPTKLNVKRDSNYTTNTQIETPNTPMYLSFYNETAMDYFVLNYHQNYNRLDIQLGLSPKLNYIIEFNNKKNIYKNIHYLTFPKNLYVENEAENPIVKYKQQFNSVFKICHACLIEFRTTQIPIQKELQTQSGVSSSILTDFEIPVSSMNQNGMFYFNSKQKRLYPITSEYFKSYDLQVFIKYINSDENKQYVPLYIKPNERVNVKLEIEERL